MESWPGEVGRDELVRYFTLTGEDVERINRSARGTPAKLGLAVQLCVLPWLGFVPEDVRAAPGVVVSRLAARLGVPAGALGLYGARAQTRTDHLRLVASQLGWSTAAHLAFLARRRSLRPSEEYRVPTDEEWEEFLGHFERRKVSTGICARAYSTPCAHEHACLRCPMHWPDPTLVCELLSRAATQTTSSASFGRCAANSWTSWAINSTGSTPTPSSS